MRTTYQYKEKLHLVLKYKDETSEKLSDIFHAAMRMICASYPIDPLRGPEDKIKMCKRCQGMVWEKPQGFMSPKLIKVLGKQLGIKVTVVSFLEKCSGEVEERVAEA